MVVYAEVSLRWMKMFLPCLLGGKEPAVVGPLDVDVKTAVLFSMVDLAWSSTCWAKRVVLDASPSIPECRVHWRPICFSAAPLQGLRNRICTVPICVVVTSSDGPEDVLGDTVVVVVVGEFWRFFCWMRFKLVFVVTHY